MAELKVSPGLEDRLLEYAAAAEAVSDHAASDPIAPGRNRHASGEGGDGFPITESRFLGFREPDLVA
jgi:hypothetical protein